MTEQEERGAPWTIHRCRRCGIHSLSRPTRFDPWPNNPACPDEHDIESTPVVPESRVQELEGERDELRAALVAIVANGGGDYTYMRQLARAALTHSTMAEERAE